MLARVVVVFLVASAAVAEARPDETLVLVGEDPTFTSALDDALVPAGMEVVAVGMIASPATADLPARSRELADARGATATVWLLPAASGATLVAYDRGVDRLLVRDLPYTTPFSAMQAAEAARMVRTMLRALRVTSEADVAPDPAPPPPTPTSPPAPLLGASVGLGAWFQAPGDGSAPAASVAIAWRPHGLGVALAGAFAPAAAVMGTTFAGRVRDVVVAVEARRAMAVAERVRLTPAAGMALHVIELDGSIGAEAHDSRRYDPALRLGITAGYALPRGLEVGLAVAADVLVRRQRYEVGTEQILVVPRLQIVTGVIVGIRL